MSDDAGIEALQEEGTEAPPLPPSPLTQPEPAKPVDLPFALFAPLLAIPAVLLGLAATAVLTQSLGFSPPSALFRGPYHLPFMVSGAVIVDRLTNRLRRPMRWAVGMGIGAAVSAVPIGDLPALCCRHNRDVLHFVGETTALLLTGALAGAFMGLVSRPGEGRLWKLVLTGVASQTMLLALGMGIGFAGMMPLPLYARGPALVHLYPLLPCLSGPIWGALFGLVMFLALLPEARAMQQAWRVGFIWDL